MFFSPCLGYPIVGFGISVTFLYVVSQVILIVENNIIEFIGYRAGQWLVLGIGCVSVGAWNYE